MMQVKLWSEGYKCTKKAFSVVPKVSPQCRKGGSRCKMANSSSEDETDTLPERPTRIQPYQFEPARQDFERVPVFHGFCEIALTEVLATQMGVMWHSKEVRSFELYKLNQLSPHCGSIARELVHCYTWGHLRIVTDRGNTVGRHS